MNDFTVKTPTGLVTGPIQTWITAMLETMSPEIRGLVFERVKQMEAGKLTIINPDGSTTIVLRAEKGVLRVNGGELGG